MIFCVRLLGRGRSQEEGIEEEGREEKRRWLQDEGQNLGTFFLIIYMVEAILIRCCFLLPSSCEQNEIPCTYFNI